MKRHTWTSIGLVSVGLLGALGCGGKAFLGDSQQDPLSEGEQPGSAGGSSGQVDIDDTGEAGSGGEQPVDDGALPDDDVPVDDDVPPTGAPCEGKACGEACETPCPAGQACAAVVSFCGADGNCSPVEPMCEAEPPGVANTCGGKVCGEICSTVCPPGQLCPAVVSFCGADGKCSPLEPVCENEPPPDPSTYQPCKGKTCGDECNACAPGLQCLIGAGFCNADAQCLPIKPMCEAGATCPESCAVPDLCQLCDDGSCAIAKPECNQNGTCGNIDWVCPSVKPECAVDTDCPMIGAPCELCEFGGAACPVSECVKGQCSHSFPQCSTYDSCKDKDDGEACTLCAPRDKDCIESGVAKVCLDDVCQSAASQNQ